MTKREEVQKSLGDKWEQYGEGIIKASVRLGKTRIALSKIKENERIVIVYPRNDIAKEWKAEIKLLGIISSNIEFITFASLKKHTYKECDLLIIDEVHELSPANADYLGTFIYKKRMGLTGTLEHKTEKWLKLVLNMEVVAEYSLAQAIEDKIVKDYSIRIHLINLDDVDTYVQTKKFGKEVKLTEREAYDSYTSTIEYFKEKLLNCTKEEYPRFLMGHKKYIGLRTNLLYNSKALIFFTQKLLRWCDGYKVLIYSMRTDICNQLSNVVYHSGNKDDDVLERFKVSLDTHMATCNMIKAGVTIENLEQVVIHTVTSDTETLEQKIGRALLYEYDGKAKVDLMCLKGTQQEEWVLSATKGLDPDKISYVNHLGESMETLIPKVRYLINKYPNKMLAFFRNELVNVLSENVTAGRVEIQFVNSEKTYNVNREKIKYLKI